MKLLEEFLVAVHVVTGICVLAAPEPPILPPALVADDAIVPFAMNYPETRLVHAINNYRVARGYPILVVDTTLMRVARERVSVFNHKHPRYGWVREHARRAGFKGFATDNLAQGYATPEEAVGDAKSGWGDERRGHTVGHDMQLKGYAKLNGRWLNYHFDRVGVACCGRNYIAVFGRLDGK